MTTLLLLLVFPLLWPFAAKLIWKHEITVLEMLGNLAVGVVIVLIGWYAGKYVQAMDVQVLNGQVQGKYSERVSCSHSYSCNCVESCSGSGQNRSCSTTCQTCYDHPYDVDWNLKTSVGELEINRVDRQGTVEPPRYTKAAAGDPVAKTEAYLNYIKAAPSSLFNSLSDKTALSLYGDKVPEYPREVYDYHYLDRVLSVGVPVPELPAWNLELANRLRTLGVAKEVNTVVLFTKEANPQFATAVHAKWLGGKKNDVIVVVGTPKFPEIAWVRVLSWTDREVFKVQLRDALFDLKTVDRNTLLGTVTTHIEKGFKRRPMADFAYLDEEVEPPGWLLAVLFVVSAAVSIFTSIKLSQNSVSSGGWGGGRYTTSSRFSSNPLSWRPRSRSRNKFR